jgi:mannan polymerase II complex MNN11 subunit
LVLGLDYEKFGPDYLEKIIENRKHYAMAHGYAIYARFVQEFKDDYTISYNHNPSWAKVSLCRAAMLAFPTAKYFWYLDETALIMNPLLNLEEHILEPKALGPEMIKDVPVVSNSDIIRTYKYTKPEQVQFILSQDDQGFNTVSFIFRNSEYSSSIMEYWNDPGHRQYKGFPRAEASALNHLAIWHHTMLSKMAVVPARKIASLSGSTNGNRAYADGDFVAVFDCDSDQKPCVKDFNRFWNGRGLVKQA